MDLTEEQLLNSDGEEFINTNQGNPSNSDILEYLKAMKSDLCTKKDLKSLKASVTSDIKSIENKVQGTITNLDSLQNRILELESGERLAAFKHELQKQRTLRNNLSIMGIPAQNGEVLNRIVMDVFGKLNCDLSINDIEGTYRTKGKNPMIIVKLSNYEAKSTVLKAKAKSTIHRNRLSQ